MFVILNMNKRTILEENILDDLFFGAKTYGTGPEYRQKVKEYFDGLIRQAEEKGKVELNDGTVIECSPELVKHFAKRYST